jgi:hypothetical protein
MAAVVDHGDNTRPAIPLRLRFRCSYHSPRYVER